MRISDWSSDVCSSDLLAGCAESKRDSGGGGDKFVFAGSAEPVTLDPFFASDGESFRVSRQIFEGLVGTKPGTADPPPLLAKSWETSEDGLTYTFTLERSEEHTSELQSLMRISYAVFCFTKKNKDPLNTDRDHTPL